MIDVKGKRAGWWPLATMLVALLALAPPNAAGKSGRDSFEGGINPTNVAVVDTDLQFAVAGLAEALIGCEEAHGLARGEGITVAVLDGGFDCGHPELAPFVVFPGYDAIDGDDDPTDFGNGFDDNGDGIVDGGLGHGTFVAGMVLKSAPDARILPIRIRDDEGFGTNAELVDGIHYAMAAGVQVMNLSVDGAQCQDLGLKSLLAEARNLGIVVVVSAGNDGDGRLPKIADVDDIVAVGATEYDDRIAEFSNTDDKPKSTLMFAPGVDLVGPYGDSAEALQAVWSGTSFSAGLVSGAAALRRSFHPGESVRSVLGAFEASGETVFESDGEALSSSTRLNLVRVLHACGE